MPMSYSLEALNMGYRPQNRGIFLSCPSGSNLIIWTLKVEEEFKRVRGHTRRDRKEVKCERDCLPMPASEMKEGGHELQH